MKIWIKLLIAGVIGTILAFFVPHNNSIVNNIFSTISVISINALLYFSIAYIFVKVFLSFYKIKNQEINKKIFLIFLLIILIATSFAAIVAFGIMNVNQYHYEAFSVDRDSVTNAKPLKLFSFSDIFKKIFSDNVFFVFSGNRMPNIFILPIFLLGLLMGFAAFKVKKKSLYFVEVLEAFDAMLDWIVKYILELFPIGVIFIILSLAKESIFSPSKFNFILQPIIIISICFSIIIIFYSLFLYIILRRNIFKFYREIAGALLVSLITGNPASTIIPLTEHLKKNVGVKNEIADLLTPLGVVLNKSGTVIVSTVLLFTIFFAENQDILTFAFQIIILMLVLLFSFRLDGANSLSFLALIAMILNVKVLSLEYNAYLVFIIAIPVFSRLASFLDTFTTAVFVTITSKFTDNIKIVDYKASI